MSAATPSTFKVGLVQMRSGLDAAGQSRGRASPRSSEAKRAGADYVLTPEMTNILALKREQLFAAIVAEENDPTLADACAKLARKLAILHPYRLARDQGVARQGGEPLVPDRPQAAT